MNECKLLFEENHLKNNNIVIATKNNIQNIELSKKNIVLLDTLSSKVILLKFDKNIENAINVYFENATKTQKMCLNILTPKKKTLNYNDSLIKTTNFTVSDILDFNDDYFINLAFEHLTNNKYNVTKEGIIEYRQFILSNNKDNAIYFDVYKDDEILGYNTETCIFITQSNDLITGNIDFYNFEHSSPKTQTFLNASFENTERTMIKKEIIVSNNTLILISGNILYCPQPLYGKGIRNLIFVKLRNINNNRI